MEITNNLCTNALRKVGLLIGEASRLEMDISGYGVADENQNSGNVYLWLEDYPFTLYIGLSDDDRIHAMWTNPDNGDEYEIESFDNNLDDLYQWVQELELEHC